MKRLAVPLLALALAGAVAPPPTQARDADKPRPAPTSARDVAITQQVVLHQDVGPITVRYKEFRGPESGVQPSSPDDLVGKNGYSSGVLEYSMKTYRLKERERTYDYYLLDVTALVKPDPEKWKNYGTARITLGTKGTVPYTTYSKRERADSGDCRRIALSLSAGLGPISAGTDVGEITLGNCDGHFKTQEITSSTGRTYRHTGIASARKITMQKWVRVARGSKPTFTVTTLVSQDRCARYADVNPPGQICEVDRGYESRRFYISSQP